MHSHVPCEPCFPKSSQTSASPRQNLWRHECFSYSNNPVGHLELRALPPLLVDFFKSFKAGKSFTWELSEDTLNYPGSEGQEQNDDIGGLGGPGKQSPEVDLGAGGPALASGAAPECSSPLAMGLVSIRAGRAHAAALGHRAPAGAPPVPGSQLAVSLAGGQAAGVAG